MFYCCKCIIQAVDAKLIICCNTLNKNLRLMVSVLAVSCHPYYTCVYPYQQARLRMQHSRGRGLMECPRKPRPSMNRRRVEREFYFPGRGQLHRLAVIYMNTCPLSTPLYNTGSSRETCPSEPTVFHLIGHGRKDLGLQPQVRNTVLNVKF